MSVRPVDSAALRVTATALPLRYDLRWYDGSESIVPLWWLGVWGPGADDLFRTGVLRDRSGCPPGSSTTGWSGRCPRWAASRLVADAVGYGPGGRRLAS